MAELEVPDTAASTLLTRDHERWLQQMIVGGRIGEAWHWAMQRGDPATAFDKENADPHPWQGRSGQTMAARLLSIMGDDRRATTMHLRNFRRHPDDPAARFYACFQVMGRFGPWRALNMTRPFLEAHADARENPDYGDLWTFLGEIYSQYRDFERAWQCLDLAAALLGDDAWLEVCKIRLLLREDRSDESLAVGEAAVKRYPRYFSLAATVADRYWMNNRDGDAFALLEGAHRETEHPDYAAQLTAFYDEAEQLEKGLAMLDDYEKRALRADKKTRKWIAGYRASLHYQLGHGEAMLPFAKKSKYGFYKKIAKRVRKGQFAAGQRVRLRVPFVRQSSMTCAPATLTALSHYFDRPADHLEIAEQICYDGTTDYKERQWAEAEGWIVREFRPDWDTTRTLIDRGLPFAVVTVEATSAHLQAIVGYDSRAATLIIRDPGKRHYGEYRQKAFFKDYAHCGPRALIMVPADQAEKLAKLDLPDSELYDLCYRFNHALETHDRPAAAESHQQLVTRAPDHRLVQHTACLLADYDGDPRAALDAFEQLIKLFPKVERFRYYRYCRRRNFVNREEQMRFLRERLDRKQIFILYFRELADLLAEDARELDEALYYYRRALRYRSTDADVIYGQAGVLWQMREFEAATERYRFAACLSDKSESYSTAYFRASRRIGETDSGLAILRRRFESFGHQSSGPAISLCGALRDLDLDEEVFPLIETALEKLGDDGDFLVYAATQYAHFGSRERARELLAQCAGKVSAQDLLRLEATIEAQQSHPDLALAAWRRLLEIEPLNMGAHSSVARLLGKLESDSAAIDHLRRAAEEFPHHVPLNELLVSWLRDEGPGHAEQALRKLLEIQPTNAWAWRELAVELDDLNRPADAIEAAGHSVDLQPLNSWSHSTIGLAHEQNRDFTAAADAYRRSLELDVDNHVALAGLVRVSPDSDARREALRFIEGQLAEQVLYGETLHTFQRVAWSVVDSDELLAALQRANEARPDLWETWSVLADQLMSMGRPEEARDYAQQTTARFPMMPRGWYDLGMIHRELGDSDAEIAAFEKALELNPQWDRPLRALALTREKIGEPETAVALLRQAVAENPSDAANHGCLADLLWRLGERDAAFEALVAAVRAAPDYGWGWNQLGAWGRVLDRRDAAIAEGERLAEERPTDPDSWQTLAGLHLAFDESAERIDALDRGITLHPGHDQLHDEKAWALCAAGRYDEAIEACSETHWDAGQRPRIVAAREAWIENERGNHALAIERMETVAGAHSDYYWAHECLADWYQRDERYDDALRQCRHLIRLSPLEAQPHGYLGDLHLAREENAEAVECFSKAFEIAPSYAFAGYQLVRLRLEAEEFDEARAALEILEYHNPTDAGVAKLRVWLESDDKQRDATLEAFQSLCRLDSVSEQTLDFAESKLVKRGLGARITEVYHQALSEESARSPAIAARWAIMRVASDWRRAVKELKALELSGDMADSAWQEIIYELERSDRDNVALHVIRKNRERFRSSTLLWGSAGYVFHRAGKFRKNSQWMADYREREDVRTWMIYNLAESLAECRGFAAAGEAYAWSTEELPTDHDTWRQHARAGYFLATAGSLDQARRHLELADQGHLEDYDRYFHHLGVYLVAALGDGQIDGTHLKAAVSAYPKWSGESHARKLLRRAARLTLPAVLTRSGAAGLAWRSLLPW